MSDKAKAIAYAAEIRQELQDFLDSWPELPDDLKKEFQDIDRKLYRVQMALQKDEK